MRPRQVLLAIGTAALLLSGCGEESATTATAPSDATSPAPEPSPTESPSALVEPGLPAVVTDASGAQVTVSDVSRIVSLTGSTTEVIHTLGLFDNLAGVDLSATWPPEARQLPQIGYQRALAEETLETPAAKVRAIAEALGVPDAGERVAQAVDREIAEARELGENAEGAPRTAFIYYRGPETIFLGGRGAVSQTMIEAAGGIDAGAESGIEGTVPLTPEALAAAQPDILLFPQLGLDEAGGVDGALGLPGVAQTPAAQNRRIIGIDDQALLGLGPRTGSAPRELVEALHAGA